MRGGNIISKIKHSFHKKSITRRMKIIEKQKNSKFHDWANSVLSDCKVKNIWFYVKTNIVRAPLEALIILYLVEAWVIFTHDFITEQQMLPVSDLVYIIFFPLALSAAVCLGYSLVAAIAVMEWTSRIKKRYQNSQFESDKVDEQYFEIDRSFAFCMGIIHIIGALCYCISSWFIANSFIYRFSMENNVLAKLTVLGLIAGVLWNIYGYFSDRRIDWCQVFTFLEGISIKSTESIRTWKLRYLKYSVISQLINCTLIIGFAIYILLSLKIDFIKGADKLSELISCSALLTLFISVASLYVKQTYKMFFTRAYDESIIFPLFYEFAKPKDS